MAQHGSSIFAAQEHKRQERLREEAVKLKKQEEEIRRRQEEIAKELMASDMSVSSVDEVMVCQAREGQVFVGKKPHYLETVLDSNVVDVQQLNTSDWSSSDAESMQKDSIGDLNSLFIFLKSFSINSKLPWRVVKGDCRNSKYSKQQDNHATLFLLNKLHL